MFDCIQSILSGLFDWLKWCIPKIYHFQLLTFVATNSNSSYCLINISQISFYKIIRLGQGELTGIINNKHC